MQKSLVCFFVFVLIINTNAKDWNLVWSDEFTYVGLPDSTKWDYEEGYIRNNEKQYYTKNRLQNARVENGLLVIEAHKEKFKEFDYTSASINTKGKAHFKYGRFEVKAKVPTGVGTWPAIWMLGTNMDKVGWPTCGEIDIMENVGFNQNMIHGNIHTKSYNHTIGTGKGDKRKVSEPYENFYIYAIEWFENRIDFYINDEKYFSFKNEGTGVKTWPFDQEFYLLINLAIGGAWGGQEGIDDSIFPQKYFIDYVRIYSKK
jgi:beta-glucanase (GH16 family)